MVGCDKSKASLRSQTQASPSAWEATSDISRSRAGSARAFSSGAMRSAASIDSGSFANGEQHATVWVKTDVDWAAPQGRDQCRWVGQADQRRISRGKPGWSLGAAETMRPP